MIKIFVVIMCLLGIIYITNMKRKYHNTSKDDIIKYFKNNNATSFENGIKIKDLPTEISKSPNLLIMVQDKTLSFKKGKYFLGK